MNPAHNLNPGARHPGACFQEKFTTEYVFPDEYLGKLMLEILCFHERMTMECVVPNRVDSQGMGLVTYTCILGVLLARLLLRFVGLCVAHRVIIG